MDGIVNKTILITIIITIIIIIIVIAVLPSHIFGFPFVVTLLVP